MRFYEYNKRDVPIFCVSPFFFTWPAKANKSRSQNMDLGVDTARDQRDKQSVRVCGKGESLKGYHYRIFLSRFFGQQQAMGLFNFFMKTVFRKDVKFLTLLFLPTHSVPFNFSLRYSHIISIYDFTLLVSW